MDTEQDAPKLIDAFDRIGGLPDAGEGLEDFAERVEPGDAIRIAYEVAERLRDHEQGPFYEFPCSELMMPEAVGIAIDEPAMPVTVAYALPYAAPAIRKALNIVNPSPSDPDCKGGQQRA